MRRGQIIFGLFIGIAAITACRKTSTSLSPVAMPPGATNLFAIDLQEGFYQNLEAYIAVDGWEIYRGRPRTNPVLGLAEVISATATSLHPVVTFTIPSKGIRWSQQIDLSAGVALGISLTKEGQVEVRQAAGFAYE